MQPCDVRFSPDCCCFCLCLVMLSLRKKDQNKTAWWFFFCLSNTLMKEKKTEFAPNCLSPLYLLTQTTSSPNPTEKLFFFLFVCFWSLKMLHSKKSFSTTQNALEILQSNMFSTPTGIIRFWDVSEVMKICRRGRNREVKMWLVVTFEGQCCIKKRKVR